MTGCAAELDVLPTVAHLLATSLQPGLPGACSVLHSCTCRTPLGRCRDVRPSSLTKTSMLSLPMSYTDAAGSSLIHVAARLGHAHTILLLSLVAPDLPQSQNATSEVRWVRRDALRVVVRQACKAGSPRRQHTLGCTDSIRCLTVKSFSACCPFANTFSPNIATLAIAGAPGSGNPLRAHQRYCRAAAGGAQQRYLPEPPRHRPSALSLCRGTPGSHPPPAASPPRGGGSAQHAQLAAAARRWAPLPLQRCS